MIPLTKPFFTEAEAGAAAEAVRSGWVTQGERVAEFEGLVAEYLGARHAIAVTNCTSALHIALMCLGVGRDDEVVVPSLTFPATANAVVHAGARPKFVDVSPETFNVDPDLLEEVMTPGTRAIMPVHQVGLPADMDRIRVKAIQCRAAIVEDAASAIGAEYKGTKVGANSGTACFSFHPRKIATTGEGGMLVTCLDSIAETARELRSHGASVSDLERHRIGTPVIESYGRAGYNYRMTDIQAAIGVAQMAKLPNIIKLRRKAAKYYNRLLTSEKRIILPSEPQYAKHNFQSYIIRIRPPTNRNAVMARMLSKGVSTRRGLIATHLEPYYRAMSGSEIFSTSPLPVTEAIAADSLAIPLFPGITEEQQDRVVETLVEAL